MTDEAIEGQEAQDVSEATESTESAATEAQDTAEQGLSPRDQKMQDLVAKRNQMLEEEMDDHRAVGNLPPKEPAEEEPDTEPTLEAEALQDDSISAEPETRELVVNGRKVTLTKEQYEAALQKDLSGDWKLQEANKREQQLKQWEQQLAQRQQQLKETASSPSKQDVSDEALRSAAKEAVENLISGDTDEAVEGLVRAMTSTRTEVDVNALKDSIKSEVRQEENEKAFKQAVEDAWDSFAKEDKYASVATDPVMLAACDAYLAELRKKPDHKMSIEEEFKAAGDYVLERFAPQPVKPGNTSERKDRKEKLKPIPQASGNVVRKKVEQPTVDLSPKGAIERMRSARMTGG